MATGNESNVTKRHNTDVFEEINKVDVLAYLDDRNEQEIYTFHNKLGEGHFNEWLSPFFLV